MLNDCLSHTDREESWIQLFQSLMECKRTCQDNFSPCNIPLISLLLPQTGTDFAQTARTAFLTCWQIFFLKRCIEIPKNAILCVRVFSDQLCNANGPRAQVQHDELVTRLSFGETVEFLQAEVFVL